MFSGLLELIVHVKIVNISRLPSERHSSQFILAVAWSVVVKRLLVTKSYFSPCQTSFQLRLTTCWKADLNDFNWAERQCPMMIVLSKEKHSSSILMFFFASRVHFRWSRRESVWTFSLEHWWIPFLRLHCIYRSKFERAEHSALFSIKLSRAKFHWRCWERISPSSVSVVQATIES